MAPPFARVVYMQFSNGSADAAGRFLSTALSPTRRQGPVEHIVDRDGPEQTSGFVAHAHGEHVVRGETLGDLAVADVGRDRGFGFDALPELIQLMKFLRSSKTNM